MAKEQNNLECDCGHVAGSPFTLRAHQKTHDGVVEKVKKVVRRKAK